MKAFTDSTQSTHTPYISYNKSLHYLRVRLGTTECLLNFAATYPTIYNIEHYAYCLPLLHGWLRGMERVNTSSAYPCSRSLMVELIESELIESHRVKYQLYNSISPTLQLYIANCITLY